MDAGISAGWAPVAPPAPHAAGFSRRVNPSALAGCAPTQTRSGQGAGTPTAIRPLSRAKLGGAFDTAAFLSRAPRAQGWRSPVHSPRDVGCRIAGGRGYARPRVPGARRAGAVRASQASFPLNQGPWSESLSDWLRQPLGTVSLPPLTSAPGAADADSTESLPPSPTASVAESATETAQDRREIERDVQAHRMSLEELRDLLDKGHLDPAEYDLHVAERAVQLACWLTQRVQAQLRREEEEAQSKADKSFVTVADYGVQAVVSWALSQAYPGETISMIAEEDTKDLTGEANVEILQRLVATVNSCLTMAPRVGLPALDRPLTAVETLAGISRGAGGGGAVGRHWVLDPVDGTLGFVRQDQYAVALALIVDGELALGVLGCPNLPTRGGWLRHPHRYLRVAEKFFPPEEDSWTRGVVMKASKGKGAFMEPLWLGDGSELSDSEGKGHVNGVARGDLDIDYAEARRIQVRVSPVSDPSEAVFCEPVEKANSNQGLTGQLAKNLGMTNEALRMYSMAKYAAVSRGDAEIFMKFAKSTYREKIWDHAAGVIIVEEAGGVVTDAGGKPLDFSRGRFLDSLDRGIVATNSIELHNKLLAEVESSWRSSTL